MAAGDYAESHLSVILREPLGVIGVVTPWNYPLLMAAWKLAPILAAGNTVVIKPSEQTPLSTLKLAELVADLLPAGVLNVVTGLGPVVGSRLASHPDIDMIALTGSVGSGRAVARDAADSLKRVHLELGGKAPVVVFEDADLDLVATGLRTASFYNSGQECGAACRVLVHESVADQLVDRLVAQVREMVVGVPEAGDDVEVGPLVSKAHYERVLGHLDRAFADGARAAVGGGAIDGTGYFVQPTVLVDMPVGSACTQEEIFGPVVTVETFADEDEAIARANEVPFGSPPRSGPTTRAAATTSLGASTPARYGSTPIWCWPTRCRGAVSRGRATGATCRSTRSTTTPAPSTSCTTTVADPDRSATDRPIAHQRGALAGQQAPTHAVAPGGSSAGRHCELEDDDAQFSLTSTDSSALP